MARLRPFVLIALVCLAASPALANRCGDQNPPRCGQDDQTDPPDPMLGGTGGCTDASMVGLPMFQRTGSCPTGFTEVIYDVGQPFPDNGEPGDTDVIGKTSFMIVRAGDKSPCAHMVDDVDPKVCPDPDLCPGSSVQPEGAIKVPVTGYMVGCWSPRDHDGCRDFALYTKSICIHAQHQFLGSGCGMDGDLDCSQVSVEQVAIDVPGAKNRRTCAPTNPANSCRGTRRNGEPGFRFWIGGFCSTNNCANPGTAPEVDPVNTCKVAWGATKLGYDIPPGKNINAPGWYDWKTGAFKVDLSSPKPTCGPLGRCLGERTGQFWDLRLVAVPRPGQAPPCIGDPTCDPPGCAP